MINCDDVIVYHVMQAEDHVTEEVVTNDDTVTHPSATANGNEPVEPHPSNDNENSTSSEHHCSTLTNGIIDHSITSSSISEEVPAVSNEGRGDLSSMVNGRCSPVEKQVEEITGLTSTQQQQSYSSK